MFTSSRTGGKPAAAAKMRLGAIRIGQIGDGLDGALGDAILVVADMGDDGPAVAEQRLAISAPTRFPAPVTIAVPRSMPALLSFRLNAATQ